MNYNFVRVKNIYKLNDDDILNYKKQIIELIKKMKKKIKFQVYNMYTNFTIGSLCAISTVVSEDANVYLSCGITSLFLISFALYECLNSLEMKKIYQNYKKHLNRIDNEIKVRKINKNPRF